jgi:hypothetical protein
VPTTRYDVRWPYIINTFKREHVINEVNVLLFLTVSSFGDNNTKYIIPESTILTIIELDVCRLPITVSLSFQPFVFNYNVPYVIQFNKQPVTN